MERISVVSNAWTARCRNHRLGRRQFRALEASRDVERVPPPIAEALTTENSCVRSPSDAVGCSSATVYVLFAKRRSSRKAISNSVRGQTSQLHGELALL